MASHSTSHHPPAHRARRNARPRPAGHKPLAIAALALGAMALAIPGGGVAQQCASSPKPGGGPEDMVFRCGDGRPAEGLDAGPGDDEIVIVNPSEPNPGLQPDDPNLYAHTGSYVGGAGDDTIRLRRREAGPNENPLLLADRPQVVESHDGQIFGDLIAQESTPEDGNDRIFLEAGRVPAVRGGGGGDEITLDGAVVAGVTHHPAVGLFPGYILGDDGDDIIILRRGSVLASPGYSSAGGGVFGGRGHDTITLIEALIDGNIHGDSEAREGGDDTILLEGGTVTGNVYGGFGRDTIILDGTEVAGDILGDRPGDAASHDTIILRAGSVRWILSGPGNDRVELSGATVTGGINGGDGVDILLVEAPAALAGGGVTNWERIRVRRARLSLTGTLSLREADGSGMPAEVVVGDQDGSEVTESLREGITLVDATLELLGPTAEIQGNVVVDGDSTLLAATPDGAGEFALRPRATGERSRLWLDGTLDLSGADPAAGDRFTFEDRVDLGGSARFVVDADLHGTEIETDSLVFGASSGMFGGPGTLVVNIVGGLPSSFIGRGRQCIRLPDILVGLEGGPVPLDPVLRFEGGRRPDEHVKAPFVRTVTVSFGDAGQGQEPSDVYLKVLDEAVLAQVYGYSILAELMREDLPTLRDRLKGRRHGGTGGAGAQAGAGKAAGWARIAGDRRDIEHDGGLETGAWSAERAAAEFGVDFPMDFPSGPGTLGLSAHATRGEADARSGAEPRPDAAGIDATGYGAGASITLFPNGEVYIDAQGRVTFWDAEVEVGARGLRQRMDALGWGASLEVGRRLALGQDVAVIPRGRLVYTDVDLGGFTDPDGAEVVQGESASLVAEGGVTVERAAPDSGLAVFADVSVGHDLLQDSSIRASGHRFRSGHDDTWARAQLGLSCEAESGARAYLAVDVDSSLDGFGDSWGYGLRAGFRTTF